MNDIQNDEQIDEITDEIVTDTSSQGGDDIQTEKKPPKISWI